MTGRWGVLYSVGVTHGGIPERAGLGRALRGSVPFALLSRRPLAERRRDICHRSPNPVD